MFEPRTSFLIVWNDLFAGSIHDWERSPDADGVLRFDTEDEAKAYVTEYVWETPVTIRAICERFMVRRK